MKFINFFRVALAVCILPILGACQQQEGRQRQIDNSPMPVVASPPYGCDYIPLRALEIMTGTRNPLTDGSFDLGNSEEGGRGICAVYRSDGDRRRVMIISLTPSGTREIVEDNLKEGALPLPEIVPGAIGYYFAPRDSDKNDAYAHLISARNETLNVQMSHGAPGRDNAADVAALMKLIAPKLLGADATSSPSPTAKRAEKSGEG